MQLQRLLFSLFLWLVAVCALPPGDRSSRDVLDTGSFHDLEGSDGVFPREISDKYSVLDDDDDDDEEDEDENEGIKEAISQFERRTLPGSEPLTHQINGPTCDNREGLYVPMLYAGYISSDGTEWKRYQCDARDENDNWRMVSNKNGPTKLPAMAITDNLATCASISMISRKGVIKTHIPPYVCTILDDRKKLTDEPELHAQTDLVREASKKLKDEYLSKMGGPSKVKIVAVTGPYPNGPNDDTQEARNRLRDRAARLTKYLFDMNMDYWYRVPSALITDYPPGWRSTAVDLTKNPPAFYVEDERLMFDIP